MKKSRFALSMMAWVIILLLSAPFSNLWAATEDYAGAYTFTFSGALSGIAIMHVDTSGNLEGVIWSQEEQAVDYVLGGAHVDDNGDFLFSSICGLVVEGSITLEGIINGTWEYNYGQTGTLVGEKDDGSLDAFVGSYAGTFSGDESGTWHAEITADGNISGELRPTDQIDSVDVNIGMVDSAGNVVMITDNEISIKGLVHSSGLISGIWNDGTHTGTFTNQAGDGDADGDGTATGDGGGDSSGACFISTLKP